MAQLHPPLGGIHEAALYVHDLAAAERFWRRIGLQLVGKKDGRHVFFRAGRDMLLLFDADASLGSDGVPPHGARGPGHVAFDAPSAEDLVEWKAHLERAGVEVEHEQRWPSGGVSVYFRDPSGNSIEVVTRGAWGF